MIEIEPETKLLFWNKQLEELWSPRISRIRKAYNTTELSTFIAGMRRVYVYHINSARFEQSYEFLRKNGLVFFPTNKSGLYKGFSHKHLPVKPGQPFTLYGAAVKYNDQKAGELFTEYSGTPTNHVGIGRLLGYPECCLEFFGKKWGKPSVDPIFEAALRTKETKRVGDEVSLKCHPYCNQMLRYFGIRITPHLTCSMQCEATIKWGEEWFIVMRQVDAEAAEWALELLSMPLTWNCYRGVAIINTPIFRGVSNSDGKETVHKVVNLGWNST